jgi:hypothetical protein
MSIARTDATPTAHPASRGEVNAVVTMGLAFGLAYAWLYLTGAIYAYHYFLNLRIPPLMVEIPREHYLLYGGFVVRQFMPWVLALAVLLVAAAAVWRRYRFDAGPMKAPLIAVALLAAFWLGHEAGVIAAEQNFLALRDDGFRDFDRIEVYPRDASMVVQEKSPWATPELHTGCYRLLLSDQTRMFLVRPVQDAPTAEVTLVVLPWDEIGSTKMLPPGSNCS